MQNGVLNTLSAKKSAKCHVMKQASPPTTVAYIRAALSTRSAFRYCPLAIRPATIFDTARGRLYEERISIILYTLNAVE